MLDYVDTDEDLLLKQALEMSMQPTASDDEQTSAAAPSLASRDFSMMSEDEQVAYAMQMSMDPTSAGRSDTAAVGFSLLRQSTLLKCSHTEWLL